MTLGKIIDLGSVQNVKIMANNHDLVATPYNDDPSFAHIPHGYDISFTAYRTGPELEDYQLQIAQNFRDGVAIKAGYLNETVNNPDGSVSRYQYKGFDFYVTEVADVSREKLIQLAVKGRASSKIKLAA